MVKDLRREARDLKEVAAGQTLELHLLKKKHAGRWGALFLIPHAQARIGVRNRQGLNPDRWLGRP